MHDFLCKREEKLLIDEYVSRNNVTRVTERPQKLMTDGLWDIYNMLFDREKPYIWKKAGGRGRRCGQTVLYYIADITLHYDMKYYYYDNTGCELPDFEDEYIEMTLLRIENEEYDRLGNKHFQRDFLCQETVHIKERTVKETLAELSQGNEINQKEFLCSVLRNENLWLPTKEEISRARLINELPVI
jgi:hypothetical protein